MSDLYMTPQEVPLADTDDGLELVIPTTFQEALSYAQQIIWLYLHKQNKLVEGENITLTDNPDGTTTITATLEGGQDGRGIKSIVGTVGPTGTDVVVTLTDDTTQTFFVERGPQGPSGQNGQNGAPGYSPSANIQQTATGAVVTITDEFGTTQAEISNGRDGAPGQPGADGVSPTASVQSITGGARITITDANGTTTADVMDGSDGTNGSDGSDGVGISSIAFKEKDASGNNVYTITLTNSNTYDFTANRGPQGVQGPQGIPGSGEDGVGISNITFDHEDASGNYVYLVTLSNNQTYTFTAPRGPQGLKGIQGVQGDPGVQGNPGNDGVSPVANVQSITGGARITITDANGTTTADVMDGAAGQNGQNGAPGYSPTASIQQTANGATITITDENGTTTATITNGQNGSNGVGISGITFKETDANGNNVYTVTLTDSSTYDITCPKGVAGTNGISPSASVAAITGGARITITDANGTTTADVMDGATGQTGPAGPGVPSGGTDGQVLTKDGSTDYATKWATPSGGGGRSLVKHNITIQRYNFDYGYSGVSNPSLLLAGQSYQAQYSLQQSGGNCGINTGDIEVVVLTDGTDDAIISCIRNYQMDSSRSDIQFAKIFLQTTMAISVTPGDIVYECIVNDYSWTYLLVNTTNIDTVVLKEGVATYFYAPQYYAYAVGSYTVTYTKSTNKLRIAIRGAKMTAPNISIPSGSNVQIYLA